VGVGAAKLPWGALVNFSEREEETLPEHFTV
jgi:hypothetical protein